MTTATDPEALDKLVDGELDEASRTALLRALDRTPDGWKRCALAFLEAQTWSATLRIPTSDSAPATVRSSSVGHGQLRRPFVRQLFAVAAMVLVAFSAGFVSRGTESSHPLASGNPAATVETEQAVPRGTEPEPLPRLTQAPPHTIPAVPERLRLQMERQGYQVTGDRKLVPVALSDGRRVAIPVDTVSYRYVGRRIQ